MKKILEKLCSVRVILTVLCLLSFAMEARADVAYTRPDPIDLLMPHLGCLQAGLIISLLVICSSALGYWFKILKPVIRFIQVFLLGVFFLIWGLFLINGKTFDFPDFVCLLLLTAVTICMCLFSGVWTKWKITSKTVSYGLCGCLGLFCAAFLFGYFYSLFFGVFYVAAIDPQWGGLVNFANELTVYLLVLTALLIAVSLILGFIMKRKNNSESNSENSDLQPGGFADNPAPANGKADSADTHISVRNKIYKRFIQFSIFLLTALTIILCIEFVYLPYCVYRVYKKETKHTIEYEIKKGISVIVAEDNIFRSFQWVVEYDKNHCSVELEHCEPDVHGMDGGCVKVTTDQKAGVKLKLMRRSIWERVVLPWEDDDVPREAPVEKHPYRGPDRRPGDDGGVSAVNTSHFHNVHNARRHRDDDGGPHSNVVHSNHTPETW